MATGCAKNKASLGLAGSKSGVLIGACQKLIQNGGRTRGLQHGCILRRRRQQDFRVEFCSHKKDGMATRGRCATDPCSAPAGKGLRARSTATGARVASEYEAEGGRVQSARHPETAPGGARCRGLARLPRSLLQYYFVAWSQLLQRLANMEIFVFRNSTRARSYSTAAGIFSTSL